MYRPLAIAAVLAASLLNAGCPMLAGGGAGEAGVAPTQPTLATQGTILGLQTYLMMQQTKASAAAQTAKTPQDAEKQRARAAAAGNIMSSLAPLRTEVNCARRLQLATAVSGGLQAEFPNYQTELSLGTNLVSILVSGVPGCQ
jgi:hypothetical protein